MLTDFIAKYASDNNFEGTDKTTVHAYGNTYDSIFSRFEGHARILEIGVLSGAFLQALSEYLPGAHIDGLDIDLGHVRYANNRVRYIQHDANQSSALALLAPTYDVIIEDSSHVPADQLGMLDLYAPLLAPGGTYIIEDIAESSLADLQAQVPKLAEKHGLTLEWHDLRHEKQRYDDILAILCRP
jgi:spermidine synthase